MKSAFRLLSLGLAVLAAVPAAGQVGPGDPKIRPPRSSPPVSPYLGLLNRSDNRALNYYQIYRPQRRAAEAIQNLSRDVDRIDRRLERRPGPGSGTLQYRLGPTGHPTAFMNYETYFPGQRR